MVPVKLILQGIHSYRERQEIDFTQLTAAGLFGVFGKVGSGKSTILEAITFCLFGDMERLNNRENRSYNLMNLRSDRLFVDFEFWAGSENNRYRFVLEGRRNGRKFHDVNLERRAFQWMAELKDWAPIATENPAERIVGLSYENFKRTVIIPQGRFQEFIELRDADRTRMMKELFQLEKFELADKTKNLIERNNATLSRIEGTLQGLGEVSIELLTQTQHELKQVEELWKIETDRLTQKRDEHRQIENLKGLFDRLLEVTAILQTLQSQQDDIQKRREFLQQYEHFERTFKPILEEQEKIAQRQQRLQVEIDAQTKALTQLKEEWAAHEQVAVTLRPAYQARTQTQNHLGQLRTLARLRHMQADQQHLKERIQQGERLKQGRKELLDAQKRELQQCREQLAQTRQQLPDLTQLAAIRGWFDHRQYLEKERDKLKAQAHEWLQHQKSIEEQTQVLSKNAPLPLEAGTFDQLFAQILKHQKALLQSTDQLQVQLIHLQTQWSIQQSAGTLEDGMPCPLCGSLHHPALLPSSDQLEIEIARIQAQQDQYRQLVNQDLNALMRALQGLQKEWEVVENQKKNLKENLYPALLSDIAQHEKLFIWPAFDKSQREPVEEAWQRCQTQQDSLKQMEQSVEVLTKNIEESERELQEKFEKPLSELVAIVAMKSGEISNTEAQIQGLVLSEWEGWTTEQLLHHAQQEENALQELIRQFERLEQQMNLQNDQKNQREGQLSTLQQQWQAWVSDQKELECKLNTLLQQHAGMTRERVQQVLAHPLHIPTEREAIQQYDSIYQASKQEAASLHKATEGKTLNATRYAQLWDEIKAHEDELNRLTQTIGRLKAAAEKQTLQIEQQKELLTEKRKLEIRKTDLETLSKLFKASGFVNYVSSVYLQNLCHQANERFHRMTQQQLQLEINDSNNFVVRDLLNDGKVRALNTLSGGQKFQAALALALALADNVHAQAQAKENFFFLDEGFGSLDKESLQTVFDTLKSLRRENRIVGVISHVEDLQQEIDRYLSVSNDPDKGSVVTLW